MTGVGFGYVGLAFPIILGLVPAGGAFPARGSRRARRCAFGYIGMMISPLHVCMVVSAEHFKDRTAGDDSSICHSSRLIFMIAALAYVVLLASILG